MRIAFLIQDLFQQGAQYVTALLTRGFIAKGYDVDLILSKIHQDLLDKGDIKPFEVPKETQIIILPNSKARNNIKAIRNYLKTNTPDAIVAMSTNYNFALAIAALKLPRKVRKKCVISYVEHSGLAGFNPKTMQLLRPSRFSKGWIQSLLLNHSYDIIMGVSEGTAHAIEYTMRRLHGSVVPIYNPVIDDIYIKKLSSQTQNKWLIAKSIPTVVAAGAHSGFKNHRNLFEAIKLANKITPIRLVLFGKGQLTEYYEKWIMDNNMGDRIFLAGHTQNLPAEIKAADAFIISSDIESFSIVLVEAMAAGTPIISTDCPYGPPELLLHGRYGTLVPVNNPQALADAIVKQIQYPQPAAPREAWEKFKVENVVNAYEKALGFIK